MGSAGPQSCRSGELRCRTCGGGAQVNGAPAHTDASLISDTTCTSDTDDICWTMLDHSAAGCRGENRASPAFTGFHRLSFQLQSRVCTRGTHGREEAAEEPVTHREPSRPTDAGKFCVRELSGPASQTTFRPQSPAAPRSCPKGISIVLVLRVLRIGRVHPTDAQRSGLILKLRRKIAFHQSSGHH